MYWEQEGQEGECMVGFTVLQGREYGIIFTSKLGLSLVEFRLGSIHILHNQEGWGTKMITYFMNSSEGSIQKKKCPKKWKKSKRGGDQRRRSKIPQFKMWTF